MTTTVPINVTDHNIADALRQMLGALFESGQIQALLAPVLDHDQSTIMPALIHDPEQLHRVMAISPAFAVNAARLAARLTRKSPGIRLAAVLRPCELRAFIELAKLKQACREDIILISIDCPGAYSNRTWMKKTAQADATSLTAHFIGQALAGRDDPDLSTACRICIEPVAGQADIRINLFAENAADQLPAISQTPLGKQTLDAIAPADAADCRGPENFETERIARQQAERDRILQATGEAVDHPHKLAAYLSRCVNCYNCRVACPVCYCRECVFVTDVFDYEPAQYIDQATRRGAVRMPTDTLFYHLTRLTHIGLSCVGCGQCANACPNDIPLAELFIMTAETAQNSFDYRAGRGLDEALPLSVFNKDEFTDVVGMQDPEVGP